SQGAWDLQVDKEWLADGQRRGRLAGQCVGAGDASRHDAVFREGGGRLERDSCLSVLAGHHAGVPVGRLDKLLARLDGAGFCGYTGSEPLGGELLEVLRVLGIDCLLPERLDTEAIHLAPERPSP